MGREREVSNETPRPEAALVGASAPVDPLDTTDTIPAVGGHPDAVHRHGAAAPEPAEAAALAALIAAPRPRPLVAADARWARSLRRFGRATVWLLPAGSICFALTGMVTWPAAGAPGRWLAVTTIGLALSLLGQAGLAALLAATRGRLIAVLAVLAAAPGTVLVAVTLGMLGQPTGAVGRFLAVAGLWLFGLGWVATGGAVLASRVLNRVDGALVLMAVALAGAAAYLSWQFLLAVAAMMLLAGALGVAWTATRISPDGTLRVED